MPSRLTAITDNSRYRWLPRCIKANVALRKSPSLDSAAISRSLRVDSAFPSKFHGHRHIPSLFCRQQRFLGQNRRGCHDALPSHARAGSSQEAYASRHRRVASLRPGLASPFRERNSVQTICKWESHAPGKADRSSPQFSVRRQLERTSRSEVFQTRASRSRWTR